MTCGSALVGRLAMQSDDECYGWLAKWKGQKSTKKGETRRGQTKKMSETKTQANKTNKGNIRENILANWCARPSRTGYCHQLIT